MNTIQQTEDYSSFKSIIGNRTINKAQVAKLYESFGNLPSLVQATPIIVNDKMEIIDGQHRFQAWKKLGVPIAYYQVNGLTLGDVQVMNSSTKNWTPLDYAKSYSALGKPDYDIYLKFKSKYKLSHNVLLSYLGKINNLDKSDEMGSIRGLNNTVQTFRKGLFQVVDEKKSEILCKDLIEVQQYYKRGDSRSFAIAFKIAHASPKYNHAQMMEKMALLGSTIKDSPFAEDYMRQLEKIYNYHMGSANRVRLY